MERRVRAERGPSARERCGNDWHSPPVFMGRVNQMPIFRDVPGEASNRYGKLLTRLTGHTKTAKNGQNTGFLRLARPSQRRSRTWRWERKRGAALLSFSVCLFRAGIWLTAWTGRAGATAASGMMAFWPAVQREAAGELELSVRQVKRLRYALKKRSGNRSPSPVFAYLHLGRCLR